MKYKAALTSFITFLNVFETAGKKDKERKDNLGKCFSGVCNDDVH